jgi:hypothetical protein
MNRTARIVGCTLVGVLFFAGAAWADALNVTGAITDQATSDPVSGAVIAVTTGFGGSAQTVYDTTGDDGLYEINTTVAPGFGGGGTSIVIGVEATGYLSQNQMTMVPTPNDGTPDSIEQDFALEAGEDPVGDSLYVSGTVTAAESGAPIPGATVTVSLVSGMGEQTADATTDDSGNYTVAMVNEDMAGMGWVEASADGYAPDRVRITIMNPDDGNADSFTEDFALNVAVYDTLTVVGRVLDSLTSDPLPNAWAVITYHTGSGQSETDSIQTGSDGRFQLLMEVLQMPFGVDWTIRLAGYVEKSGRSGVTNDTADIGTVDLAEEPTFTRGSQARMPVVRRGSVAVYSMDGRLLFSSDNLTSAAAIQRLNGLKSSGQAFIVRRSGGADMRNEILVPTR